MPLKKHNSQKNIPKHNQKEALVPRKDDVGKSKPLQQAPTKVTKTRVTALSTVGKKKKPK